jgi:hypothetical protein
MNPNVYVAEIVRQAGTKPLLIESPFWVSEIKGPLEQQGFQVTLIFIQEDLLVIHDRYFRREHKVIPKGHLTLQGTFKKGADACGAFQGTSSECLAHLKQVIDANYK